MRQSSFQFKGRKKPRKDHGGEKHALAGKRKEERPFDPSKRLHVTLRSSLATGELSLLHPKRSRIIRRTVERAAERHGIVLHRWINVGNHLHLLIQTRSRRVIAARSCLAAFLREISGLIARVVTGAKKGQPAKQRFWDYLAWSRVVDWGRDLAGVVRYFAKNEREFLWILSENNWPSPELPARILAPD